LCEEVKIVEKQNNGVLGDGLVEGGGDLDKGVVVIEAVGAKIGADYRYEAFGRYVVY
jgi:hypothetical protein